MQSARQYLIDFLNHYRNEFLTLDGLAEYHGLEKSEAEALLWLSREIEAKTPKRDILKV